MSLFSISHGIGNPPRSRFFSSSFLAGDCAGACRRFAEFKFVNCGSLDALKADPVNRQLGGDAGMNAKTDLGPMKKRLSLRFDGQKIVFFVVVR